jgi:Xaa-Pro aminopeptidase
MPPGTGLKRRLVLRALLESQKLDALLVSTSVNVRYYSGFTGSDGLLLVLPSRSILYTDPRYQEQAPQEIAGNADISVEIARGSLTKAVNKTLSKVKTLGKPQIGIEAAQVTCEVAEKLAKVGTLKGVSKLVDAPRWVKSDWEVEQIRASVQLNSRALERAMKRFRLGMTEKDLAAEIDYQQRKLGAEGVAFETIVASGAHSALPHARPRDAKIAAGQFLLIDMGASLNGYMSDMTRTFGVGKMPSKAKRYYDAVLEAQLAATDAVRPKAKAKDVHAAAVAVLERYGLAKLFMHSTGHGLGLEIHEAPRMGKSSRESLRRGMAVTIEPGVYEPGFGGVRIEDTVLVTETGCEVLTESKKDWTIVD